MSTIMDRFNNLFRHDRAARSEQVEMEAQIEEAKERKAAAELYRWATDDVCSGSFLPMLDNVIDRLEREQAENVENHAKMTLLQGRIMSLKDTRRMFHEWRRLDAKE